jgi:hypothetical protein
LSLYDGAVGDDEHNDIICTPRSSSSCGSSSRSISLSSLGPLSMRVGTGDGTVELLSFMEKECEVFNLNGRMLASRNSWLITVSLRNRYTRVSTQEADNRDKLTLKVSGVCHSNSSSSSSDLERLLPVLG